MLESGRPRRRGLYVALAAGLAILLAAAAVLAYAATSQPTLSADPLALAQLGLPFGGGSVERVTVVGGREQQLVPVKLRQGQIWPTGLLDVHERIAIDVTVKRPGWISWLSGDTQRVRLTLFTPSARLRAQYVTVRSGQPLRLSFAQPVRVLEYGSTAEHLSRRVLSSPTGSVSLPAPAPAGTLAVAAAPRVWESPRPRFVSWFPPGTAATAVASPAPGSQILPDTHITLTFSKPVAEVLGDHLPPVSPTTAGNWRKVNSHTIVFEPQGYGYGLGSSVTIPLPSGVRLLGAQAHGADPLGRWSVPVGSTLRLQQMLAILGYLPLSFHYDGAHVAPTLDAQMKAALHPPAGHFDWRYPNTPSVLRSAWAAGSAGVITRGAVMAFEDDHGITPDGVAGPQVWKAVIEADMKGDRSSFGYTYVMVSEGSPESIEVWHNGHTVVTGPVNTGVAAAPTATGTYPVFEHLRVTTMSGTNPDGSHYSDPGIPWVSYFNGGDALHGFIRGSYGFPQSDGCVEMPYSQAARVYPYTPIGTLVNVS